MKKSSQPIIAVNATALTHGGARSILQQFLQHVPAEGTYYVFVDDKSIFKGSSVNVHFVNVNINTWVKRVIWDSFGFKRSLNTRGIIADVVLSLQNTSIAYDKSAKHVIYLHQGVFLHPKKWSFFKKNERVLAFYKYIYPLFVFLHVHKKTKFVVQTTWMKHALCKRFHCNEQNVSVIKPDIIRVDTQIVQKITLPHTYTLFYPSTCAAFKNHQEIIHALHALKIMHPKFSSIGLYLTIKEDENSSLVRLIQQLGLTKNVCFLGTLNYNQVLVYYKSCNIVVFPSFIESFGLPLLEAAMFGKPLVVTDTAYAREVIFGYTGTIFVPQNVTRLWMDGIVKALSMGEVGSFKPKYESGWADFFKIIQER